MNKTKVTAFLTAAALAATALLQACSQEPRLYNGPEYVLFSDTISVHAVMQDRDCFTIPVVATRAFDYDRTLAVEIVDEGSTAIEGRDFRLASNTITIPAGELRADVMVHPVYEAFNDTDTLSFNLRLVMPDALNWDLYGNKTKVSMFKVCPFSLDTFTGWSVVTSLFLYNYPGMENDSYQRLVRTEAVPGRENTIVMHDWLFTGYDVTLTFDPSDPLAPRVTMDEDQVLSDEESVFGTTYGDNRILVTSSPVYTSYYNSCQQFVSLWIQAYVYDMSEYYGSVGHFYNVIEWISDEEAERLQREEGM